MLQTYRYYPIQASIYICPKDINSVRLIFSLILDMKIMILKIHVPNKIYKNVSFSL